MSDDMRGKIRFESHSDDGVLMCTILDPEMREAFEHCAREDGVSIEEYLTGVIDRHMEKMAEELAQRRGITVDQLREELDQQPDPNAREKEILDALERSLEGDEK